MSITGTHIQYFFVCHRKLWLFAHNIQLEQESDEVLKGKLLHENTYKREKKEFSIGPIKVDWVDFENSIIHEVKKSDKMEIAHIWQLKYYLWLLKTMGAGNFSGEINYPKLKQKVKINLLEEDLDKLNSICKEIEIIISSEDIPQPINKNFCKKCSYFELCYI